MAVTLHTGKRGAEYTRPGGIDPIHYCGRSELFIVGTAFIVGHGIAVKSGRNILGIGRVGQQVACHLLFQKNIIRFVFIECIDYPIPVAPDSPAPVGFISSGIRIAGKIEPHAGPFFTEAR